jgi:hypothetical protein
VKNLGVALIAPDKKFLLKRDYCVRCSGTHNVHIFISRIDVTRVMMENLCQSEVYLCTVHISEYYRNALTIQLMTSAHCHASGPSSSCPPTWKPNHIHQMLSSLTLNRTRKWYNVHVTDPGQIRCPTLHTGEGSQAHHEIPITALSHEAGNVQRGSNHAIL